MKLTTKFRTPDGKFDKKAYNKEYLREYAQTLEYKAYRREENPLGTEN